MFNFCRYEIVEVTFPVPLKSKEKFLIKVSSIHTHELVPKPKEITQGDYQKMYYTGNHFVAALYPSKQITQVRCMQVISHSENEQPTFIDDEQQIVTFGSYDNVPAWSYSPSFVHFVNLGEFITVNNLDRHIEVSHWGNILVEESFIIHNDGTPLKGQFSRLDFMLGRHGNGINEFVQHLPEGAWEIYYRDIIGNISTSHVYPHRDFVNFEIKPRFVLFGGWRDEFKIGYNLPAGPYLSVDGSRYTLTLPFVNNFENAVFDEVSFNVVLPEGATDVDISASEVSYFDQSETVKQTYLDTTGRVVVSFRAKNLVSEHRYQKLVVSYSFEYSGMIREPLFLIAGFFCLFLLAIAYFRTNISITDEVASVSEEQVKNLIGEYYNTLKERETKYEPITNNKNIAKKLGQFNTEIQASYNVSDNIISRISSVDNSVANELRKIEKISKKKTIAFRQLQSLKSAPRTEKTAMQAESLTDDYADASDAIRNSLRTLSDRLNN